METAGVLKDVSAGRFKYYGCQFCQTEAFVIFIIVCGCVLRKRDLAELGNCNGITKAARGSVKILHLCRVLIRFRI